MLNTYTPHLLFVIYIINPGIYDTKLNELLSREVHRDNKVVPDGVGGGGGGGEPHCSY